LAQWARTDAEETQHQLVTERKKLMGLILLIVLIVLLLGTVPTWPHSRNWGYGPSGGLGTILLIVIVLILLGYLPRGF
jgi:hypothetical protein